MLAVIISVAPVLNLVRMETLETAVAKISSRADAATVRRFRDVERNQERSFGLEPCLTDSSFNP